MDPTVITGYSTDPALVGYSPNDFFYNTLTTQGTFKPNECPVKSPVDCKEPIVDDNIAGCENQAYCDNLDKSNTIMANQAVHTAADGRYSDTVQLYNTQLLTTINLGVGILGVGLFIFYNH